MKSRPSKLDAFSDQLTEWFIGEKLTLQAAQQRLAGLGCSVSISRVGAWWEAQQTQRMQDQLLDRIATGAQASRQIEQQFAKDAPPGLETLLKLLRVQIMTLSMQGQADPELLQLAGNLLKPVMEHLKIEQKREELDLAKDKFHRETCELFLRWRSDQRAQEIADSGASNSEKIDRLMQTMFADL
jgi:hypothetical protein